MFRSRTLVRLVKFLGVIVAAAAIAGCSFESKNERQADKITRAVIANDLSPVRDDIAKGINIPRVQVAEWSDELNAQGKLLAIKETTTNCSPGWHCFNVKFEKHQYTERMRLDENGKVVNWNFKMVPASS